jgi:hypothetical protein
MLPNPSQASPTYWRAAPAVVAIGQRTVGTSADLLVAAFDGYRAGEIVPQVRVLFALTVRSGDETRESIKQLTITR